VCWRQLLHRRVGEALRHQLADSGAAEPELLAHHFTQAGLTEVAIEWWGTAGQRSLARCAGDRQCPAYVRYCFADPMDAAIFRSRFEPRSERVYLCGLSRRVIATVRTLIANELCGLLPARRGPHHGSRVEQASDL
jgi:hypothetical protein